MRRHEQKYLDALDAKLLYNVSGAAGGGNMIAFMERKEYNKLCKAKSKAGKAYMKSLTQEERDAKFGRNGSQNGMFGKTHTKEARAKIVKALTGNKKLIAVRKGKTFEEIYGEDRAKEIRKKLSDSAKVRFVGEGNPFFGKSHSEEVKEHISKMNKGNKPPNMRKVKIGKTTYESATAAAKKLGVTTGTICHRIKSPNVKFKDYKYLT
jgi:group I intron endonuclease